MGWLRKLLIKVDTNERILALELKNRAIEKAYGRLEHDSEEMWETVRKALGRISRLKRDTDSGKLEAAAKTGTPPVQQSFSPAEERIQILRRAKGAVSTHPVTD